MPRYDLAHLIHVGVAIAGSLLLIAIPLVGVILLFLCWTGRGVDEELVQSLLDVINGTGGFTLLDTLLIAAAEASGAGGGNAREGIALSAVHRRFIAHGLGWNFSCTSRKRLPVTCV